MRERQRGGGTESRQKDRESVTELERKKEKEYDRVTEQQARD